MSVGPSDRTFGLQPSEFWGMSVSEWWWLFDATIEHAKSLKDHGRASTSEFDWEDARRRHKEKMNDRT